MELQILRNTEFVSLEPGDSRLFRVSGHAVEFSQWEANLPQTYRIRTRLHGGALEIHSDPLTLDTDCDPASVSLYPNPSLGHAWVQFVALEKEHVRMHLFDKLGRVIKSWDLDGQPGKNLITLDLSGIQGGVYVLKVYRPSGSESIRIVKSK